MSDKLNEVKEKRLAFRSKDLEGDAWSEDVFLFKNDGDVRRFFTPDNPMLIEVFTDDDDRSIRDFIIHDDNPAGRITSVEFNTDYAGDVRIVEMNAGYVIS